ncbi:hypothetical protein MVEN_01419900 [Mycena venus]|uniref:Uncharacterized protein n=1 Tax=Mycena venus TaxID=2733690 RepID=A0A8H6XYA8_9AGAR|nr:hypothetical protein MVEN_01419900 [Mycena venus]
MSSQPRTIKYALAFPSLICSLIVIIAMGYLASSDFQDRIYTDGLGPVGPLTDLVVGVLETLYLIIAISLTFTNIVVPTLTGILVDSLLLIPCYIIGISLPGSFIYWDYLGNEVGDCFLIPHEECRTLWHTFGALQLLAMVLQFFGLVLTIIDLVRVIQIHRDLKKKAFNEVK